MQAGTIKCVEDIRAMKESTDRYFKDSRGANFIWDDLSDERAISIMKNERREIVAFLREDDYMSFGKRYGMYAFFNLVFQFNVRGIRRIESTVFGSCL